MLYTEIHGNRSTGSKEDLFKAFYHIWTWKLSGHVTNIILTHFHFLGPKSLHIKSGQKGSSYIFDMQMTLGQSQEMTLTLNTHLLLSKKIHRFHFFL